MLKHCWLFTSLMWWDRFFSLLDQFNGIIKYHNADGTNEKRRPTLNRARKEVSLAVSKKCFNMNTKTVQVLCKYHAPRSSILLCKTSSSSCLFFFLKCLRVAISKNRRKIRRQHHQQKRTHTNICQGRHRNKIIYKYTIYNIFIYCT